MLPMCGNELGMAREKARISASHTTGSASRSTKSTMPPPPPDVVGMTAKGFLGLSLSVTRFNLDTPGS